MSNRRNTASSSRNNVDRLVHRQVPQESTAEVEIMSGGRTGDSIPSTTSPSSVSQVTNLDRLIESISPLVPSRDSLEATSSGADSHPFFCLQDLWESLKECSMYGVGVPLRLKEDIVQYYIPYLSGIQLYRSSSSQTPFFQYMEYEKPYNRQPLTDKIFDLASRYPELNSYRSCDLLETSWLSIAWYPICRIPIGPKIEASFLSFYSLSTQSTGTSAPHLAGANGGTVYDPIEKKFVLPVFGLLPYKLEDFILNPIGPHELAQENSLVQAVDNWLGYLNVPLPDYHFFRPRHNSYRR
ncbi:hypothetical protein F511_44335 [Dorcoceras hygrometricum]|uniref:Uncharacterized protein n=1 Tax=Dorcoceras hygrometricum TaxID=472368 RepID=A0A2Z6ZY04_9LAMI|nr:hypothetical protein F511_44335 [Dorcoceras hygrometricum]